MAKRKAWAKSFGPYGCRVRVYERDASGMLMLEVRRQDEQPARESLGHRDRGRGVEQAKERQAQLALGIAQTGKAPTIGALLDAFQARQGERSELTAAAAKHTDRIVTYWKAMLGAGTDASKLTLDDVERACARRRTGAVNARGEVVAKIEDRQPVRSRAIAADLEALRAVFRWAILKRRMLRENPLAGLEIPEESNVRRPLATADRYDATHAKASGVLMEIRGDGKRIEAPSYLTELLDLAYSTGRRISAICRLRYDDLRLDVQPFGALRWAAESDKMGQEWTAPMDARARAAIDRILVDREVGTRARWAASPWLFPSPRNADRAVSKDLASDWLERAEDLAQLPKLDGSLWHAYRRGWATSRKHHPLADVAAAGGWKTERMLVQVYQRPDEASTRRAVLEPRELRD